MAPTTKLESIKVCIYSDGRIVGVCVCVCVCSPRACFQGRGETRENLCVRRLVPVFRAETKTLESVDVRVSRLVPNLRAETKTQKIVDMCVRRLVPVFTYNVNCNATENVRVFILPLFLGVK